LFADGANNLESRGVPLVAPTSKLVFIKLFIGFITYLRLWIQKKEGNKVVVKDEIDHSW